MISITKKETGEMTKSKGFVEGKKLVYWTIKNRNVVLSCPVFDPLLPPKIIDDVCDWVETRLQKETSKDFLDKDGFPVIKDGNIITGDHKTAWLLKQLGVKQIGRCEIIL